ncbi:MAG: leucyl aminopeptidase [Anaerolineae bacterium]
METSVADGNVLQVETELLVVSVAQNTPTLGGATAAVDRALGGVITELVQSKDLTGKAEQITVFYTRGALPARRVMVVGLGEIDDLNLDTVRRISAAAARAVRKLHVTRFHSLVHGVDEAGLDPRAAAQAVVEGSILGGYAFNVHKTVADDVEPPLEGLTLVAPQESASVAVEEGGRAGRIIAQCACQARDLANEPANCMTPTLLAQRAEVVARQHSLAYRALDEAEMETLGMGSLLGVARGSDEPAKFIVLEHRADLKDKGTYVIVGKGITFDSGGISLKPSEGMEGMKYDMSGAAVALSIMQAVGALQIPLHVVGLIPATENLPSGHALKPGDVLTAMSGLTIEVISTDAEGRLILADALAYAQRYHPKAVVDLATLTGGCVVALGHLTAGLMGNEGSLLHAIQVASEATGEKVWQLPLFDGYDELIKSDVADVKNSGGRAASAIQGGMFLKKFAGEYPWAHIDIAGTASSDKTDGYQVKGSTGFGVRLLVQWLRDIAGAAAR